MPLSQVRNVTLIILMTALMAFGVIGATMLFDRLPIPAIHAASSINGNHRVALKSSTAN